jgi:hypothetical protein
LELTLIREVWRRAGGLCEYCQLGQSQSDLAFEIDHIIARKHGGPTRTGNLALSCFRCNSFKGSDLGGLDPKTRKLTPLYHPRRHSWTRHFRWDGPYLIGRTPIGRVTITVLKINDPFRVEVRRELIEEGVFPPPRDG